MTLGHFGRARMTFRVVIRLSPVYVPDIAGEPMATGVSLGFQSGILPAS